MEVTYAMKISAIMFIPRNIQKSETQYKIASKARGIVDIPGSSAQLIWNKNLVSYNRITKESKSNMKCLLTCDKTPQDLYTRQYDLVDNRILISFQILLHRSNKRLQLDSSRQRARRLVLRTKVLLFSTIGPIGLCSF